MEATLARKNDNLSILGPGSSLSIPLQLGTPLPNIRTCPPLESIFKDVVRSEERGYRALTPIPTCGYALGGTGSEVTDPFHQPSGSSRRTRLARWEG